MDPDRLLENERLQMQHIRELDMEELQIEEVDETSSTDDDDNFLVRHLDGQAGEHHITFNTCLASLHSYLGEVDETHGRLAFLDVDAILNLPMFYLKGVVLFPEATLPLRVILPRFKAVVERALHQVDAPYTIGVMRVHWHSDDGRVLFGTTGTTAEIRQYRRLDDGSLNVVARGQQRFRLRRSWIDVEGVPCAEVQIIKEDTPLKTPKDAIAQLASVTDFRKRHHPSAKVSGFSPLQLHNKMLTDNDWECMSGTSNGSDHSDMELKFCLSGYDSFGGYERIRECSSSDEEFSYIHGKLTRKSHRSKSHRLGQNYRFGNVGEHYRPDLDLTKESTTVEKASGINCGTIDGSRRIPRASLSFWPEWVYQMHDSYALARRAAELWKKIVGAPNLDDYIRKPDILSFHIGSKLPVSESTRQELLEIDGFSYRLRREIQLLESFNHIRCKSCLTLIAKRSDMVVMSSDGPLNAYVNPNGYVHEVITVLNATGLALAGSPVKEHSWFPGYAWTITNCAHCEKNMGWLFTATKKRLLPKSFWGIRSSQVVDDTMLD
ncbi:uncharacterized protein LOC110034109 isoform X2 [Phalaenopsis equestris]|uniref:uncharacterized protein LOC110034109 isoform X2 n=1 Tax=Phalaenopsis equestris TaxID=78828 RepID=UPI0009E2BFCA|nr:uncharacterized protein LOC110034109 isoform X2 [Phalaenopsis equestris]